MYEILLAFVSIAIVLGVMCAGDLAYRVFRAWRERRAAALRAEQAELFCFTSFSGTKSRHK